MPTFKFYFILLFITLLGNKIFAQNYNINILPARVNFDKENGLDLFLLFKYVELERKVNKNFSANLGIYYAHVKEDFSLSYLKSNYYNFDPSIRYYLNKKQNLSGFYVGSGVNYAHSTVISKGREASIDGSILENDIKYDFLNINLYTGYKFVLIKNRFSIDFKLNQQFNIYNNKKQEITNSIGQIDEFNDRANIKRIPYPYLDLKLGYRFGFKK